MEEQVLYYQIADSIRKDILTGRYKPGDQLPPVRKLCEDWNCTPGTIQRAYHKLVQEGLLVSHPGRGTRVAGIVPQAQVQAQEVLRRAQLVHRSEAFLLEALTTGYNLSEIQQAVDLAMDRWRTLDLTPETAPRDLLRFAGSHDLVMNELAHVYFGQIEKEVALQLSYNGSLPGLMALAEGKADLAGCHLWDAETNTYNLAYIRRLLPGKDPVILTLAHRRIGLIVAPGNPFRVKELPDLARAGIRFVNRQPGSGTRVWLDAMLAEQGISAERIEGYADERLTHSDIARLVAEGAVDVGLGLETAARAYGLDFVFLNRERYDLVMLAATAELPPLQRLTAWLSSPQGKALVDRHPGYDSQMTGQVQSIS